MSNSNQIKSIHEILLDVLNQDISVDEAEFMISEIMNSVSECAYLEGHSSSLDDGYSEIQSNY